MKFEKNYKIERIRFESNELEKAQMVFYEANYDLTKQIIKDSLKYVFAHEFYLFCLFLIAFITSISFKYYFQANFFAVCLISSFFYTVFLTAYIAFYQYFIWTKWIKEILSESDLCAMNAHKTYSKENNAFFVAINDAKEIMGCAGILMEDDKNVFTDPIVPFLKNHESLLIRVATLPKHRGKGVAKNCVTACIEFAKKKNCKLIKMVSTNRQKFALKIYKSFGFEITEHVNLNKFLDFEELLLELKL